MYKLAKMLYPKNPRLVRCRKLRILGFTIALSTFACVAVGTAMFLLNRAPVY